MYCLWPCVTVGRVQDEDTWRLRSIVGDASDKQLIQELP